MKRIITLVCVAVCSTFLIACGSTAETTVENTEETVQSFDELEFEDVETYDIKTSVVTLKYPLKWKDVIETEVTDEGVKFSSDGVELFDVMFVEGEDAVPIGRYNGTIICIKVPQNATTEDQLAMQDDVNVIIENIEKDPNFTR